MYLTGLGAKIVRMRAPVQAAAGLEDVLDDVEVGDLGVCGNVATGRPCRGFAAGGILEQCVCVNLHDADTTAEVKHLLSTAAGERVSASLVWTLADEDVLAAWAEARSGVHLPDVSRPWRSGYVSVGDLVQRTEAGDIYPTGQGILALLDEAGCMPDAEGVCPGYDRLNGAIEALRAGAGALDETAAVKVYPPFFGETSGRKVIQPGDAPPSGAELHVDLGISRSSAWLGWTALVVGTAAAALYWRTRG